MSEQRLPIQYRDFHDVPRMIVVQRGAAVLLLDCPFDEQADEYPSWYALRFDSTRRKSVSERSVAPFFSALRAPNSQAP